MKKFDMMLCSFRQVQAFVALAMKQPFDVRVGNDHQHINGKDFMGMFSLDYTRPVQVTVTCSDEEFARFRHLACQISS